MKDLEILDEAIKLVTKGWCQSASARDDRGYVTHFQHHEATRFCISGAVRRALSMHGSDSGLLLECLCYSIAGVRTRLPNWYRVINFNDSHTKGEVIDLMSKARVRLTLIKDRRDALRRMR